MLLQTIPLSAPLWAVLADEDGKPVIERCVCLGCYDLDPQKGHRMVFGISLAQNGHLEPPDEKEGFVGYSDTDPTGDPLWTKRAADTRALIIKATAESKIYVPPNRKIAEHVH